MKRTTSELNQSILDRVARGEFSRRGFLGSTLAAAMLAACRSVPGGKQAIEAGDNQARNLSELKGSYDYVVVGAGAAGSVIAGELSKHGVDVLVIESGGPDTAPTIANPSIWFYNVGSPMDFSLPLAPTKYTDNRAIKMALGHVVGGGSSINAMVWARGMERDYDDWAKNGAAGWAFKDVLPMFKAQEDWEGGANEWRGAGGPMQIRRPGDPHPTAPAFIEAAKQMGFPIVDDLNGPMRVGAGYINMNIAADGSRVSAARGFLRPNLDRKNLTLMSNTDVTRVLFEGDRAVGVEIANAEGVKQIRIRREVVMAAGTIHSAKLLMLSGIGNADELAKLGITPVSNLRGVGQNLQDHTLLAGVIFKYKGKMPDRPADSDAVEAQAYLSSGVDNRTGDISLVLEQLPIATPEAAARFGAPPQEGFTIAPALVQPTARGRVRLASASWKDEPIVEANHLGSDHDLAAIVKAIELARELGAQKAFDGLREAEAIPGPNYKDRSDLEALARAAAGSFGHAVGTAKIGTDSDAVVDGELRVHGVRGLRVADASVMPRIPSGATNAPSIMIGGRAAEMLLKGKWS